MKNMMKFTAVVLLALSISTQASAIEPEYFHNTSEGCGVMADLSGRKLEFYKDGRLTEDLDGYVTMVSPGFAFSFTSTTADYKLQPEDYHDYENKVRNLYRTQIGWFSNGDKELVCGDMRETDSSNFLK